MSVTINKISIIIPIHNEEIILEENITAIVAELDEIHDLDIEIILIENGSKDNTKKIADNLKIKYNYIHVLSINKANYGLALKTGFTAATGDIIVNYDIDFWDCKFLKTATHIMRSEYDIIIASKNLLLSKDHRGPIRRVATAVFRYILLLVFGLQISDTHGIKAWRNNQKLQKYFHQSKPTRHTYDTEIIIRAIRENCEILELPIDIRESRISEQHIIRRVPEALFEIAQLYLRLR